MTPNIDILKDFSALQATVEALSKSNIDLAQRNAKMRETLEGIATASPSKWEMRSGEFQMQFQPWAQNRARHTLQSANAKGELPRPN